MSFKIKIPCKTQRALEHNKMDATAAQIAGYETWSQQLSQNL